jgi:serine/threonine protein kinase
MAAEVIAGRYILCDPIGAGGSGTVWRAFDSKLQQYCAAKLLRQRDAGELLRFAREQSVRLHHPNIVSPYAWAADDGMVLIASELIDGGSLQVLLGDYGALAEETVVEVLDQVLSALDAVHTAELIHRDVKPGNLLLRATGNGPLQMMLADFGLTISRRDARLTATGMVIGTPGYLPPEVLIGRVSPEPAHDMYAVGRLALAMLAGAEVPTVNQDTYPIADDRLREVVHALLSPDPESRPATALAARTMLTTAHRSTTPKSGDGEPITVLDQLPPLPAGWGKAGELTSRAVQRGQAGGPRATLVEHEHAAPDGPSAGLRVDQSSAPPHTASVSPAEKVPAEPSDVAGRRTAGAATAPHPLVARTSGAAGPTQAVTERIRTQGSTDGPPTPQGPTTPSGPDGLAAAGGRRRVPWRAMVGAVIGLALVVVVGIVLIRNAGTGSGTGPPSSSVSTPPVTGSTAATTDADLRAGDACGWQVEGDRRNTIDGELVCAVDSGGYRWVVSPG